MIDIELNQAENEWYKSLDSFRISLEEKFEDRILKLNNSRLLTTSLLKRNAVPEIRVKFFTDPAYNLSDTRKSKRQIFEQNGTSGTEIFSHPDFLKYLKYFIHGADLPTTLKDQLSLMKESSFYDDDFVEKAYPILRAYFKESGSNDRHSFVEETFKLFLDLGVDLRFSKVLRDKLMKAR